MSVALLGFTNTDTHWQGPSSHPPVWLLIHILPTKRSRQKKHVYGSLFFLLGTLSPSHPYSSQPCCCLANTGRKSARTQDTYNTPKDVSEYTRVEKYPDYIGKPAWIQTLQEALCTLRTCCSNSKLGSDFLGGKWGKDTEQSRGTSFLPMFSPQRPSIPCPQVL